MNDLARVSAVILLRRDGAALLQHRDDKAGLAHAGMWVPPGGHCDADEPSDACARREFFEETAYRLDGGLTPLTAFIDDNIPGHPPNHITVFWAWYDDVQEPHCLEGQALTFVERRRAGELPVPEYLVRVWDAALIAAGLT